MVTVTREHVIVAAKKSVFMVKSVIKGTNQIIPKAVCIAVQQNGACVSVACNACMTNDTGTFGVTFETLEQICKRFDVQFDLKGDSNA